MAIPCSLDNGATRRLRTRDQRAPDAVLVLREKGLIDRRQVSWLVDLRCRIVSPTFPAPSGPVVIWRTMLHLQWRDRAGVCPASLSRAVSPARPAIVIRFSRRSGQYGNARTSST